MKNKRLLFLIYFALWLPKASAQQPVNSIEVSPFMGIEIFSVARFKTQGNFYGTEAAFHLSMANNKANWVRLLNVKDVTFVTSFRYLDDVHLAAQPNVNGILGNTFGATARLSIQLTNFGGTRLMFYPGLGVLYATQSFLTTGEPLSGSNFNFAISTGLKLVTPIAATTRIMYGVDIYHYSNGAVRLPNEGVNTFNASIGIDHDIDGHGPQTTKKPFTNYDKSSLDFGVNIGRRGLVQTGAGLVGEAGANQKTAISRLYDSDIYLGYNYRVNPVLSFKLSTEGVYSYTKFDYNNFYATFQERSTSFDQFRFGAGAGIDLWLGHAAIEATYGHYIHFDGYYNEQWYWTIGPKYYFNKWIAAEGKLYLHGTEANFLGFGPLFNFK